MMTDRKVEGEPAENRIIHDTREQSKDNTGKLASPSKSIRSKGVTAIFNVNVPESTSHLNSGVYLVGSLHILSPNLPNWDANGVEMQKVNNQRWTITLICQETIADEVVVDYRYTLGDNTHIEKNQDCTDNPIRRAIFQMSSARPQAVEDTVENWGEVDPCQ